MTDELWDACQAVRAYWEWFAEKEERRLEMDGGW
jgi:hypothetical protein